jgi:hypothetical protein
MEAGERNSTPAHPADVSQRRAGRQRVDPDRPEEMTCQRHMKLPPEPPPTADHLALAKAVRKKFSKSHPDYVKTICWRYLDLYGTPPKEALRCVRMGYSSPSATMFDGVTADLR